MLTFHRMKPAPAAPLPTLDLHTVKVLSDEHAAQATTASRVICACGHISYGATRPTTDNAHDNHRAAIFAGARRRLAAFNTYQGRP